MEPGERQRIISNFSDLLKNTRYTTELIINLKQRNMLSDGDEEELNALSLSRSEKTRKLYEILMTKHGAYNLLQECLKESEQTEALRILQRGPEQLLFNIGIFNNSFSGRIVELENLNRVFNRHLSENVFDRITCITGMGGIGKTELCKVFVRKHLVQEPEMNVIWINGETNASIHSSFVGLAEKLNIETKIAGTVRNLDELVKNIVSKLRNHKITFIFDNIDNNYNNFVNDHFLKLHNEFTHHPRFLITSRYQDWNRKLGRPCAFPLENLTLEEAKTWVSKETGETSEICCVLVQKLDCYPLAIEQAIALIKNRERNCTNISTYISELSRAERKFTIFSYDKFRSATNNYKYSTFSTFFMSIQYILQNQQCSQLAMQFLRICAYMHPDFINTNYFTGDDQEQIEEALSLLKCCSLLKQVSKDSKILRIHRVLQDVLQTYFTNGLEKLTTFTRQNDLPIELEKFWLPEDAILKDALCLLPKIRTDNNQNATFVWKFACKYPNITKVHFLKTRFGTLKLTPLHLLCEEGNTNAVEYLLHSLQTVFRSRLKQLVNITDTCTRTAAFLAASKGHCRIIRLLYEFGADLRIHSSLCHNSLEKLIFRGYNTTTFTLMEIAVYNEQIDAVKTLDELDPDLRKVRDPAYLAARLGYLEIVNLLSKDDLYKRIIAVATQIAKTEDSAILFEDLHTILNNAESTELQHIFSSGNLIESLLEFSTTVPVLNLLVEKGAKLPGLDRFPESYNRIVRYNKLDVFKWLIDKNLQLESCVNIHWHWTPLFEAAKFDAIDIVEFILCNNGENGVKGLDLRIDIQDPKGDTPLYQAAYWGNLDMVKYLVKNEANVNAQNSYGSTAIIAASLRAKFDVVKYLSSLSQIVQQPALLDKGQTSLLGMLNMTVLHAAVAYDSVEMTNWLMQNFEVKNSSYLKTVLDGNGTNTTVTLLHTAAVFDSPNVIRFLKGKLEDGPWLEAKINVYKVLNIFLKAAESKTFNLSPSTYRKARFLIRLMGCFYKNYDITPFDAATLLGHHECANLLRGNHSNNEPTPLLIKLAIPKIRKFLDQMKAYLGQHGDTKLPAGMEVRDLVQGTFLGWDW